MTRTPSRASRAPPFRAAAPRATPLRTSWRSWKRCDQGRAPPKRLLRARGIRVYGSSAQATHTHYAVPLAEPSALIVGNEHEGISPACLALADEVLKIPMAGQINSLNIAVAASVLLFEARRQRAGGGAADA